MYKLLSKDFCKVTTNRKYTDDTCSGLYYVEDFLFGCDRIRCQNRTTLMTNIVPVSLVICCIACMYYWQYLLGNVSALSLCALFHWKNYVAQDILHERLPARSRDNFGPWEGVNSCVSKFASMIFRSSQAWRNKQYFNHLNLLNIEQVSLQRTYALIK